MLTFEEKLRERWLLEKPKEQEEDDRQFYDSVDCLSPGGAVQGYKIQKSPKKLDSHGREDAGEEKGAGC